MTGVWRIVLSTALAILAGCSGSTRVVMPTSAGVATPPPDLSVFVDTVYYRVAGSTADELRVQMDRSRPGNFDAHTEWYVSWSYPYSVAEGSCSTGLVTIRVNITFTLPQWNTPANASEDLVDRWNAYLAVLQVHEDGHKGIGIEAANEILQAMNALPAYRFCEELKQAADATGERVLSEYRQREAIYDQTTNHGVTQGARFP